MMIKSIAPPRRKPMATKLALAPTPPMDNVMIDLETLGRRAGCAILSIGAVAFDPDSGKLGSEFYVVVDRQSQTALHTDPETLAWWEKQSAEARAVLTDPTAIALGDALIKFNQYLAPYSFTKVKIWGNGGDFDNAIMASCYAAAGLEVPWAFWNNRCYRTLKNLVGGPKLTRQGTYHNALDDAKTQAEHAVQLFKLLRE
jgi:exodeoxyribonuclease VIII